MDDHTYNISHPRASRQLFQSQREQPTQHLSLPGRGEGPQLLRHASPPARKSLEFMDDSTTARNRLHSLLSNYAEGGGARLDGRSPPLGSEREREGRERAWQEEAKWERKWEEERQRKRERSLSPSAFKVKFKSPRSSRPRHRSGKWRFCARPMPKLVSKSLIFPM